MSSQWHSYFSLFSRFCGPSWSFLHGHLGCASPPRSRFMSCNCRGHGVQHSAECLPAIIGTQRLTASVSAPRRSTCIEPSELSTHSCRLPTRRSPHRSSVLPRRRPPSGTLKAAAGPLKLPRPLSRGSLRPFACPVRSHPGLGRLCLRCHQAAMVAAGNSRRRRPFHV